MPVYAYRCNAGHDMSVTQPAADPVPESVRCTRCELTAVRVFDAPAVVFKGPGFYSTDSKSDERKDSRT